MITNFLKNIKGKINQKRNSTAPRSLKKTRKLKIDLSFNKTPMRSSLSKFGI